MSINAVSRYFEAFNAADTDGMLDCLTDDVEHHVNQGGVRRGKAAFARFAWTDLDEPGETAKPLQFWLREL